MAAPKVWRFGGVGEDVDETPRYIPVLNRVNCMVCCMKVPTAGVRAGRMLEESKIVVKVRVPTTSPIHGEAGEIYRSHDPDI